jgi:hypothetical protein
MDGSKSNRRDKVQAVSRRFDFDPSIRVAEQRLDFVFFYKKSGEVLRAAVRSGADDFLSTNNSHMVKIVRLHKQTSEIGKEI